ncbi:unnamed protein product, partial [Allacma fusca]
STKLSKLGFNQLNFVLSAPEVLHWIGYESEFVSRMLSNNLVRNQSGITTYTIQSNTNIHNNPVKLLGGFPFDSIYCHILWQCHTKLLNHISQHKKYFILSQGLANT